MNTKGAPFISSPPDEIVKENMAILLLRLSPTILRKCGPHPFLTSQTDAWQFEPPETPGSYVVTYRLRSLSLFQGMAISALVNKLGLTRRENVIVLYLAQNNIINDTCAKYRTITFFLIVRPLFPCFLHHFSLQILCTTDFFIENVFSYLYVLAQRCPGCGQHRKALSEF